jgi:hypothetical protein
VNRARPRGRRHAPGAAVAALGVAVVVALAGCSQNVRVLPPQTAPPAASTIGATPAAQSRPVAGSPVPIDQSLLTLLPPTVGGLALQYSAEATQPVLLDPHVQAVATSLVYGVAGPATSDLLVVAVVRLRPGVFSDSFFHDWRDSYDAAACAAAGGVVGDAEVTIKNRQVFVGRCAAGANTYHVFLSTQNVIVSATSIGAAHLGQTLVETLPE